MSLIVRIGRSFAKELKRPGTVAGLIFAAIFFVGGAIQLEHNWSNETRPFWVYVMLTFCPAPVLYSTSATVDAEQGFHWKRFGAFLGVHAAFMSIYFGIFRHHFSKPLLTWSFFGVIALEMGLLIFVSKRFFAEKPATNAMEGEEL